MKRQTGSPSGAAPVHARVTLLALAAVMLAAGMITQIQLVHAAALRDALDVRQCRVTDGKEEKLLPILEDVWIKPEGMLHMRGALLRLDQDVGAVNVRMGLMREGTVIVLNTQMVRRPELARAYGCDDHCGASALARTADIPDGEYDVVFVDTAEDETRLITTGMELCFPLEEQAGEIRLEGGAA
ncbi:MAG TPA: hypothetical protein IAC49_09440 [Candidatus Ventricola intestinavium]|nr:hypothetical protein [Candidatus Ventricola intestinavium]